MPALELAGRQNVKKNRTTLELDVGKALTAGQHSNEDLS
jgi:hypothetical protein